MCWCVTPWCATCGRFQKPWKVTGGAALQQLKADLIKEGRNAPGKSILGMVECKEGSSHSFCHTEQPVTSHTWEDACYVSDLRVWMDRALSYGAQPLMGITGCINFTALSRPWAAIHILIFLPWPPRCEAENLHGCEAAEQGCTWENITEDSVMGVQSSRHEILEGLHWRVVAQESDGQIGWLCARHWARKLQDAGQDI